MADMQSQQTRPAGDGTPASAPPERVAPAVAPVSNSELEEAVDPKIHQYEPLHYSKPRRTFPIGTAIIALLVIAGCAGVLYSFAGAKVVVTPVTAEATVATDLEAFASQGDLSFQIVTVDKVATVEVASEGTVTANDPAQGSITITNKQPNAQALIKNTRFSTPTGLVFRIHDSITVPASGSLSVLVYADEPGEKYNIPPTTFVVPGLKGSAAYDLITAKSDAPMTGGFAGTRASVAQATKDTQYAAMQAQLTTELQKQLAAKIPADYVLVPGSSFPSYSPGPDTAAGTGKVTLSEKGSISAVIFPAEAFARAVAFKTIGTYDGSPVSFASVDKLVLKPVETTLAPDTQNFKFSLSGNGTVVWTIVPDKIAGAVAGKTRDSSEVALKSFMEVDKATLILRPFWKSTFPADPKKITVSVAKPGATQ